MSGISMTRSNRAAIEAVELVEARSGDANAGIFCRGADINEIDGRTGGEDGFEFLNGYSFHNLDGLKKMRVRNHRRLSLSMRISSRQAKTFVMHGAPRR